MATNTWRAHSAGWAFIFLLLVGSITVTEVIAAGSDPLMVMKTPGPDLNVTNHSFTDAEMMEDFAVTPTPITIFRAEVTAETLPGPRYMAFGPSIIGFSIDPRLLVMCFAVVIVSLVVWFVVLRKCSRKETKKEKKN
ncbi:MAG: hypothetical protein ABSG49_09835 [Methanoregula sp.]|jgi:hypothetical protein|uniref:hypothetical protein n=1 Tax=Methanoregula sp. TaxID=2052170 RepID=UPI003C28BF34